MMAKLSQMQAPHSVHDAPSSLLEALYHPHGYCYLWEPRLVWLHAAADTLIALAYYSIPLLLVWFMRRRRDVPFNWMFGSFAVFILACGTTHVMEVWNLWHADYWLAGWVKAATAGASVWTAAMLAPLIPKAIDLPSPAALERAKTAMERAEALAHFGSWEWNPATNRATWSPELHRIYGITPEQYEGTFDGYLARVHPDDRARVGGAIRAALEGKTSFRLRERIVRPDGTIRILSTAGDVILDERGGVAGMYGACHDITDQEAAETARVESELQRASLEQQFMQSQKLEAVGRLAGGIAHDFNNMLVVIMGSAALLLERRGDDHPDWRDLRAIEEAAERAGGLTQRLLAVARRQHLTVADVDLNAVVRDMEDMLRRSLGDDVRLVLELAGEPLIVRADQGQLQQVLLNLAVNARDAMPDGGALRIATSGARDASGQAVARIEVSDTGMGMTDEVRQHLFEPFFTTKGARGTGLGLATVYGIVTQSGGRITVQSAPGSGSTFSVELPRSSAEAAAAPGGGPSAAGGGSETILVVDDSEPVLSLTSRILARAGYQVLTAPSGEWAISIASRYPHEIHVLLTDVTMPGMSGPQLARQLQADRPSTRVLFMTGFQRATAEGESTVPADATLLEKPFKPEALLTAVRQVLEET